MAALTQAYLPNLARLAFRKKRDEFIEKLIPRPCMIVSVSLLIAGMCIPLLMMIRVLPPGLLLGLVGFGLVAGGGVLALIFCGEI